MCLPFPFHWLGSFGLTGAFSKEELALTIDPRAPLPHGTKSVSEVESTYSFSVRITVYLSFSQKILQGLHVLEMSEGFGEQSKAILKWYHSDWRVFPL